MPRPSTGYRNAAGIGIPGAGDITGRFCPKDGLIGWAYNRGKAGLPRFAKGEIDIGTITHQMCDMDMHGASFDDIDGYLDRTPIPPGDRAQVVRCFAGYRSWRTAFAIRPLAQEKPLVSETYQYGGTPDLIGLVPKGPALVDYKTSSKGQPYLDHLVHMAAHGRLWLENGGEPLTGGYHLLLLPKDGSPFKHLAYSEAQITPYWQLFEAWRAIYDLDQACQTTAALEGQAVVPPPAPQPAAPIPVKPAPHRKRAVKPQPRPQVAYSPLPAPMSMAEILRSYGHVREGVRA